MQKPNDLAHMRLAIREARRSIPEDDKPHPFVGAVIARDGEVLASACRGEKDPGDHAEFIVSEKKLKYDKLAGCTVFTTLEPCTTRNHPKVPCANRLIERHVKRVVIGSLDPNQDITGKGILRLRRAGIAVDLFPPELMSEIEELNREFTRDQELRQSRIQPPGIKEAGITAFYPSRDYYNLLRKDAATIDRYISTAEHTLVMVSINLMTGIPFNDLCSCLKMKIEKDDSFMTTISFLDPRRSELISTVAPILNVEPSALEATIHQGIESLFKFKQKLPEKMRNRFDIRVHSVMPFGSAILLDHGHSTGRIQIETKPYKVGLQKSIAFEVAKNAGSSDLFNTLAVSYETLVADGQSIGNEISFESFSGKT